MKRCPHCGAPVLDSHQYCPRCGGDLSQAVAAQSEDPYLGMVISGKFVLRELIGTGGMGKVYRADQVELGRTVAVKIMHRHLLGDETAAARFTNEARAASYLNHPHSISVLDFGQTEVGILYIVMEYLRGRSLDVVLQREFPLPFGRVALVLCQVAQAVEAAHKLNIIHRDLKPENVFLEDSAGKDFVKVLDFGIAKMLDLEDRSITTPGLVPGTPEYMSPEQARGEPLDPRSDVYALGVMLYELLTGSVPFRGNTALATMMSQVQDPPEPPSRRCPTRGIPESLDSLVLWALAKRADERIPSAAQFGEILAAWAEVSGVWPVEAEKRASQSSRLLEFFSRDQLAQLEAPRSAEVLPPAEPLLARRRLLPRRPGEPEAFFGRQAELRFLERFLMSARPGRTLRVVGPAGIGRSSLLRHAMRCAASLGMEVVQCQPQSVWSHTVLSQAHRLAMGCLGLSGQRPTPEALLVAARRLGVDAEELPGLEDLFGQSSRLVELPPEHRRREQVSALRHLIQRAAARRPLLLLMEDIDEHDAASKEVILSATALAPAAPVAMIFTHGPAFTQLWPPEVELLELPPLEMPACRELVLSLLGPDVALDVVDRLIEQAGQQPLFIQQLVYGMVHEGLADPPERAVDLLAARVERLPQGERNLLQWLSVFGDWVAPATLSAIMGCPASAELLEQLVGKGLLRHVQRGYGFVHRLVALAVYSTIPAEVRRHIHSQVASYLRTIDAPVMAKALHSYEAQDGPLAIQELEQAGATASRLLDDATAIAFTSRALHLVRNEWGKGRLPEAELDRMAVELARRLAALLKRAGDAMAARGVLEEILSVAAGDSASRAGLRLDLGRLDLEVGNLAQAVRRLELALADARSSGRDALLAEVCRELGRAVGLREDRPRAGQLLAEALEASYRAEAPRRGASWRSLLELAAACGQAGFPERARGHLLDALLEAEKERCALGKLQVTMRMADGHLGAGEWAEAEIRLHQALDLAAEVGDRTTRSKLLAELGHLHRIRGEAEAGRIVLEQAIRLARAIGWWEGMQRAEKEVEALRFAAPQAL